MDFVIGLLVLTNWKDETYNSILVIVDRLMKMIYYEPVKVTINALGLAEVIFNMVVQHYRLPNLIVTNKGSFFISKFWLSLCYFLGVKRQLFTAFYSQINDQTKWQNNTMKIYL